MAVSLAGVLAFASIPAASMAAGGAVAARWPPAPKTRSYIQHFAAGIVFSAAAVEVLPDVLHRRAPVAAAAGFALGVLVMLVVRAITERVGSQDGPAAGRLGLVVGIDVFVDGLLIGVMLVAGERAGALVTLALSVELLSLGLAVGATATGSGASSRRIVATTGALALLPPAGAAAGYLLLGRLQGAWMEGVLAFALAALLYLVTEELLVEAHEVRETPLSTALFFAGFFALVLAAMIG